MAYEVPHFINGQEYKHQTRQLDIYNPASGETIGCISVADQSVVNSAVKAAADAFHAWSSMTPVARARLVEKFKRLIEQNMDELAEHVTREHGKTMVESRGSIQRGLDVVDFACGIPNHLKGDYTEQVANGIDCYSIRQPVGVCVGITPFNFPAMIPLWMFPMAIACGNTFVLKPSEKNPSVSYRMLELAKEAGIPDGVINMVNGDKETVDALITHQDVKGVSFVGSSAIAEYVYKTAINHNKRAQAFGGAKNHAILMPDADFDKAVDAILMSAYGSAGERCMAISAVVAVGDETADKLVKKLTPKVKAIKMDAGSKENVEMGPLITKQHWEKVKSYVTLGQEEGATLVIDGSDDKPKGGEAGFFMGGCLFDNVKPSMRIYKEEIFGPVLCVIRANNFDEALALINHHPYANGTAVFTRDGYTARKFAQNVQVGMVGINVPVPVPVPYHSFGGWKNSIFADIGMYGPEAVRFYTKLKTITQKWLPGDAA